MVHAWCKPPQSYPKGGGIGGRGGLNSVRSTLNPKSEDRRPKAEFTATPAQERPIGSGHSRVSAFGFQVDVRH
jgi:hypothetical protein